MDLRELQHIGYRELHYFVAVAEELHFARAAERIGMNQSPLSKAITIIERDLGARLFVRTRRSTQLTELGEAFLPEAKRLLAEAARVRGNIAVAIAGHKGRLHLATSEDAALPWVAKLLSVSRSEEPGALFTIGQRTRKEQLGDFRADALDVGIVSSLIDGPVQMSEDVQAIALGSDPIVLSMRADSSLANRPVIVSLEAGMGPFMVLRSQACDAEPIRRLVHAPEDEVAVEFAESVEMLLMMVAAGHGVGLVCSALAATVSRPDVVFRPVALKRARVATYLLVRQQRTAMVERFVERARRMKQSTECSGLRPKA